MFKIFFKLFKIIGFYRRKCSMLFIWEKSKLFLWAMHISAFQVKMDQFKVASAFICRIWNNIKIIQEKFTDSLIHNCHLKYAVRRGGEMNDGN